MHGLEDIRRINADPEAYHRSREPQHYSPGHRTPEETQRLHGERVEARHRINGQPFNDQGPPKPKSDAGEILADLLLRAIISGAIQPLTSRVDQRAAAIDAEPPFLQFWQKLNDQRELAGRSEAVYHEAKELFLGGPTPGGALTFIGKKWDGLRAVPGKPHDGHKTYYGEFRQVSDDGTIWRCVHNGHGPIIYATPEAALEGARHAKHHSKAHS